MSSRDNKEFNERIRSLVDAWCERREYGALARILPAWLNNNGLTDGWTDLCDALHAWGSFRNLPDAERNELKNLWIELDRLLRNR